MDGNDIVKEKLEKVAMYKNMQQWKSNLLVSSWVPNYINEKRKTKLFDIYVA